MNPTGTAIAVQVRHQSAMDADFANRKGQSALATTVNARLQVYQQLRQQYPNASLTAELVSVQGEQFVVRAELAIAGQTIATGLGAAAQIEEAEDRARLRVLELLGFSTEAIAAPQWEVQVVAQTATVVPTQSPELQLEAGTGVIPSEPELQAEELPESVMISDFKEAQPEPARPMTVTRPQPVVSTPVTTAPSEPTTQPTAIATEPTDWSDDLAEVEVELKRLGWTEAEEQAYLLRQFGKRSRALIADYDQLLQFLDYLRSLPTPGLTPAEPEAIAPEVEPEPVRSVSLPPLQTPIAATVAALEPSRNEAMELTSAAVKRLGWTNRQGSDHLRQTYGKTSRQQLTTEELLDFLHYLHRLSPPISSEPVPF